MSFQVLVNCHTCQPAAIIHPNQKVEFLQESLLKQLQRTGIFMGSELFEKNQEKITGYHWDWYMIPPDDKASQEVHAIFAQVFFEKEVSTLLRSGYYLRGPEALEELSTERLYKSHMDALAQQQAERLAKTNLSSL